MITGRSLWGDGGGRVGSRILAFSSSRASSVLVAVILPGLRDLVIDLVKGAVAGVRGGGSSWSRTPQSGGIHPRV